MKIKNKLLFVIFLLIAVGVICFTTYINLASHSLNVLLTVISIFIPLPFLWQTNINNYKGKTKIGKLIAKESGGIGLYLCCHIIFLIIVWILGSFIVNKDDGIVSLVVVLFLVLLVLFSICITVSVDKNAKKYSSYSSSELMAKVITSESITSIGIRMMIMSAIIVGLLLLVELIGGIGSNAFNIIPDSVGDILFDMMLPGITYCSVLAIVGLLVYCIGWTKEGTISRSLNMYCERELEPWEKDYVDHHIKIEEIAKQVRLEQITGDLIGNNSIGNIIKAKGTIDAFSVMKEISTSRQKWVTIVSIIGFVLVEIIFIII